ncbi:MAG: DUF4093 domain-containing protein [Oscillospiraceae bacterium]
MIQCRQPVIVEGKYDKIKLAPLIDGTIIETNGFSIFKEKEKLEMLRVLAKKTGIIILTDSDAAGFKIRNYIRSAIREGTIIHVYIPDVYGKERRKANPSKEGKLGVEGMNLETLRECFERAGVTAEMVYAPRKEITKADLYEAGLTGIDDASEHRKILLEKLRFPEHMTTKALLPVLNTLFTKEEFLQLIK